MKKKEMATKKTEVDAKIKNSLSNEPNLSCPFKLIKHYQDDMIVTQKEENIKLSKTTVEKLLENDLTGTEWKVWFYLATLGLAEKGEVQFNLNDLMQKCKLRRSAYFKAKRKLRELGLVEFENKTIISVAKSNLYS